MHRHRLRRPSAALIVSTISLIVALGGTSYAAFSLPKNSVGTKQLKRQSVSPPKVAPATIRLFKGQKGDTGNPGPRGLQGLPGTPGSDYTIQTKLQSEQTETGVYEFWGTAPNTGSSYFGGVVNYRVPLAAPLEGTHVVFNPAGAKSTHCSGPGSADAGYLCVYESSSGFANRTFGAINAPNTAVGAEGSSTTGFGMYFVTTGTNQATWSYGSWAVTAP